MAEQQNINLTDFLNQQSRWATGGIQATPILIKPIWRSKHLTTTQKIEATVHLTNYLVFPAMVAVERFSAE